jgi:hypothetical protein
VTKPTRGQRREIHTTRHGARVGGVLRAQFHISDADTYHQSFIRGPIARDARVVPVALRRETADLMTGPVYPRGKNADRAELAVACIRRAGPEEIVGWEVRWRT